MRTQTQLSDDKCPLHNIAVAVLYEAYNLKDRECKGLKVIPPETKSNIYLPLLKGRNFMEKLGYKNSSLRNRSLLERERSLIFTSCLKATKP